MTHLHLLIFIHKKETGHILQKSCCLSFVIIVSLNGGLSRRLSRSLSGALSRGLSGALSRGRSRCLSRGLHRVVQSKFRWWRVGCNWVFPFVSTAVGAFLTVLTQVQFAGEAADDRSVFLFRTPITPSATVTVRDVSRAYRHALVALLMFLTMEPCLTTDALQLLALITFERSLVRATAGIAFLTY